MWGILQTAFPVLSPSESVDKQVMLRTETHSRSLARKGGVRAGTRVAKSRHSCQAFFSALQCYMSQAGSPVPGLPQGRSHEPEGNSMGTLFVPQSQASFLVLSLYLGSCERRVRPVCLIRSSGEPWEDYR